MTKPASHWTLPDPEYVRRATPQQQAQAGPTPAWTASRVEYGPAPVRWVDGNGFSHYALSCLVSFEASARAWALEIGYNSNQGSFTSRVIGTASGNVLTSCHGSTGSLNGVSGFSVTSMRLLVYSDSSRSTLLRTLSIPIGGAGLPASAPDVTVADATLDGLSVNWIPRPAQYNSSGSVSVAARASDAVSLSPGSHSGNAVYDRTTKRYGHSFTGLTFGTDYTASAGGGTASGRTLDPIAYPAPTFRRTAITTTSATYEFTQPTGGLNPQLQVQLAGTTTWRNVSGNSFTVGAGTPSWNPALAESTVGTDYAFQARWVNARGPTNGTAATVSGTTLTTLPGEPADLSAAGDRVHVTANWAAPATSIAATSYDYAIRTAQVPSGDLASLVRDGSTEQLQYVFRTLSDGTDLVPNRRYWIYVRSVNANGTSDWAEVAVSTTAQIAPDGAISVSRSALTKASVRIHWTAVPRAEWYEIRRGSRGDWIRVGTALQYDASGLQPGRPYTFYVRARNSASVGEVGIVGSIGIVTLPEASLTAGLRTAGRGLYDLDVDWGDTLDYDHPRARMNDRARILDFTYASGAISEWGNIAMADGIGIVAVGTLTMGNEDDLFTPNFGSFLLTPQEISGAHRFRVRDRDGDRLMFEGIMQRVAAGAEQRGIDAETAFNLVGIFERGLIAPFQYPANLVTESYDERQARYGSSREAFFDAIADAMGVRKDPGRTSMPPYDPSIGSVEGLIEWPPLGLEASEATAQWAMFAWRKMWVQPVFPLKDGRIGTRDVRGIGTAQRKVVDCNDTVLVSGNDDVAYGPMDNVIHWTGIDLNRDVEPERRPPIPRGLDCSRELSEELTVAWRSVPEATSFVVTVTGPGVSVTEEIPASITQFTQTGLQPGNVYIFRVRSKRAGLLSGEASIACTTAARATPPPEEIRRPLTFPMQAAVSGNFVTLTWNPPGPDDPPVSAFQLRLLGPDGVQRWQKSIVSPRVTDSFELEYAAGTSHDIYTALLAGQNAAGTGPETAAIIEIGFEPDLEAPTGVSCAVDPADDNDVILSFTAPSGVAQFNFYRSETRVSSAAEPVLDSSRRGSRRFADEAGGTRRYGVQSVRGEQTSAIVWASCSVAELGPPTANFSARGISSGSGRIDWTISGGGTATGYQYRRSATAFAEDASDASPLNWLPAIPIPKEADGITDVRHSTGISDDETYYYQWRSTRGTETPEPGGVIAVAVPCRRIAAPRGAAAGARHRRTGGCFLLRRARHRPVHRRVQRHPDRSEVRHRPDAAIGGVDDGDSALGGILDRPRAGDVVRFRIPQRPRERGFLRRPLGRRALERRPHPRMADGGRIAAARPAAADRIDRHRHRQRVPRRHMDAGNGEPRLR